MISTSLCCLSLRALTWDVHYPVRIFLAYGFTFEWHSNAKPYARKIPTDEQLVVSTKINTFGRLDSMIVLFCLLKTFDALSHNIASTELGYNGIHDEASNWFKSYLSKGTQYVQFSGTSPSIKDIGTRCIKSPSINIYMNDCLQKHYLYMPMTQHR